MAERNTVKAPYNFVPFAEKPIFRYASAEKLPPHDRWDPTLLTGEIHVTFDSISPVFVGATNEDPHFYKTPDGKTAIPGSSVRGMVREAMQILSFGHIKPGEDFTDARLFFREMAGKKDSVMDDLKQYYMNDVLDVHPELSDSKAPKDRMPRNVQTGFLIKTGPNYSIIPSAPPLSISRNDPLVTRLGLQKNPVPRKQRPWTEPVLYRTNADGVITALQKGTRATNGMKAGILMYTGGAVGDIPNPVYVFPLPVNRHNTVRISKEDITAYLLDLEARRNTLRGYARFWELPKGREEKPVFYVRHNGHVYFGMTMYPRIGYPYTLKDGLPQGQRSQDGQALDYVRGMLGFTQGRAGYRSRVSFGDFAAVGTPEELPALSLTLMAPKPSYFPGYTTGGRAYINENFRLRGYKLYWHKDYLPAPQDNKLSNKLCPLKAGTVFKGVIRYKNLHPDELGLLLLAIRLKEDCFHSIGKGKPYGLGRIKATVDALYEWDAKSLYSSFEVTPTPAPATQTDVYIQAFMDAFKGFGGTPDNPVWDDFFTMRSFVATAANDQTGYMDLDNGDYKNVDTPLPTVQQSVASFERSPNPDKPVTPD